MDDDSSRRIHFENEPKLTAINTKMPTSLLIFVDTARSYSQARWETIRLFTNWTEIKQDLFKLKRKILNKGLNLKIDIDNQRVNAVS